MAKYQQNAKWLTYLAPFRALSISAAYLTPFFLQNGLNLWQIFLLQSIFSVAVLLWELPSGYIADKFGRALSIKISAPIAAVSIVAYGFSHNFWQFVACELLLAIANGMISGIDTALLYDSLKADGKEKQYVKISQRINAYNFGATAAGVPIAIALVHFVSISSTLVVDGLLTAAGAIFAFKLAEAPRFKNSEDEEVEERLSVWRAAIRLARNSQARWLVLLGASLSTATYLAYWLSAPYYTELGIPAIWFSAILAVRSIYKTWLLRRPAQAHHLQRNMAIYAGLAGLVYLAMASGQVWLMWAILGHDAVQALQTQPIIDKLNAHMHHQHRATMNSLVNLAQRLMYSAAGPLVGLLIQRTSLATGFVVTGIAASSLAFLALARLHKYKTFRVEG